MITDYLNNGTHVCLSACYNMPYKKANKTKNNNVISHTIKFNKFYICQCLVY